MTSICDISDFVSLRRFVFIWLSSGLIEFTFLKKKESNLTEKFLEEIMMNR